VSELEPIERFVRVGEIPHSDALVVRGWPLTVDGLLRNADSARSRYSHRGMPFVAVSSEVVIEGWSLDRILAGPRLRTRRRFAAAPVRSIVESGFELLPTFAAPHYSILLPAYTEREAQRLLDVLGEVSINRHHVRRLQ
jgi:hypothetical protein